MTLLLLVPSTLGKKSANNSTEQQTKEKVGKKSLKKKGSVQLVVYSSYLVLQRSQFHHTNVKDSIKQIPSNRPLIVSYSHLKLVQKTI